METNEPRGASYQRSRSVKSSSNWFDGSIKQTSTKGRLDINKLKLVETNVRLREETENPG